MLTHFRKEFPPRPTFASTKGHTVLLFVAPFDVKYPTRSDDPIFPARKLVRGDASLSPGLQEFQTYWTNDELHAGVLGCVESAEICTPSMDRCGDPWLDTSLAYISDEMAATYVGMLHSGYWNSIQTRTAQVLDATRRIVDARISLPLDKAQWKLEARRLFEMSLVRAKLEVLELARGTRATNPGFLNYLDASMRGACTKIKLQAKGYKNLSFVGLMCALFGPLLLGLRVTEESEPPIVWIITGICFVCRVLCDTENPLLAWVVSGSRTLAKILSKIKKQLQPTGDLVYRTFTNGHWRPGLRRYITSAMSWLLALHRGWTSAAQRTASDQTLPR
jgi:hypothetical protein